MRLWILVVMFLVSVSRSTTFPFREVLSLIVNSRIERREYVMSYVVQRMIALFYRNYSKSNAASILRTTVLESIMETPDDIVKQVVEFKNIIDFNSEGLLSALTSVENKGPEPPIELLSLFNGARKDILKFVMGRSDVALEIELCKSMRRMEDWQRETIVEAAISWKHFRSYFEYIRSDGRLLDLETDISNFDEGMLDLDEKLSDLDTKLFDLEDKAFDLSSPISELHRALEMRLNLYLNRYEQFLKRRVQKFDFGSSFATVAAVYNFFKYLHQLSRVYAGNLSSTLVERLQKEHNKAVLDIIDFAKNIATTERTFKGSCLFEGRWYFNSHIYNGILVPSKLDSLSISMKYANLKVFTKVSLYHVCFEPRKGIKYLGMARLHSRDEQSNELILYSSRNGLDEAWLEKFVGQLKEGVITHPTILKMIDKLPV